MESRFGDSAYAYAQSWTANSKPAPAISSIHLRPFRESDLPAIRSLFDVSFPISYNDDFFECVRVQFFRGNKLVTYIAELLEEDAPELIGFIIWQERPTDGSDANGPVIREHFMYSNVLYILNIAVSEKYRNCGVGSLLIRKCVEMCEKEDLCAGVYLYVLSTNMTGISFYEKNGFHRVQRVKDFYYINEKWCDSYLYFSSPKGAHALYKSVVDDPNPAFWLVLLGFVASCSFIVYKLTSFFLKE